MSLTDKVAIVTGAGRNVGGAVASQLVEAGAFVVVAELDAARGTEMARLLNQRRDGCARFVHTDVASEASVAGLVETTVDAFGGLDVLVNNVAITDRGRTVLDLEADEWEAVLRVTLTSAYLCTRYAARAMQRSGGGSIINIGSTSAHVGRRNALAYGVAKAGLLSLTRSCAVQLGEHGIRVNTVSPNKVGSPVGQAVEADDRRRDNALGRAATPDDVAAAVVFMASDSSSFVTGTELLVDGGALIQSS